jgi:hypothetical protein
MWFGRLNGSPQSGLIILWLFYTSAIEQCTPVFKINIFVGIDHQVGLLQPAGFVCGSNGNALHMGAFGCHNAIGGIFNNQTFIGG